MKTAVTLACLLGNAALVLGLNSSSPRCEICNNVRTELPGAGEITRRFEVTDFESISNMTEFYVSLQMDFSWLARLRMTLEDENNDDQIYLWNLECSYQSDVNVVMSDLFDETVSEQDKCDSSINELIYAKPYQSLGEIGEMKIGNYTFNVESTSSSYYGYLDRICIGWFDEEGCDVTGTVSNERCEICDSTQRYFRGSNRIDRVFMVTDFESDSDDLDFYVSVKLDHNYLGYLQMTLANGTDTSVYLWNNECGSWDDLTVTFSDRYTSTVAGQGLCHWSINSELYARPYQSLGSIAADKLGQYTFSLYETSSYGGYLENVCIGWYAADGCSVSGSVIALSERPSCEICDNNRTNFPQWGILSRRFTITEFNSESGNSDFYVKVEVENVYLGKLEMTLEDETVTRYLWDKECSSNDDLNVTFSDDYDSTVSSQGACGYGLNTPVYARGYQSFGSIGETQIGRYEFNLKEAYDDYSGYLNRVCVGWYGMWARLICFSNTAVSRSLFDCATITDQTGCTVSGSVVAIGLTAGSPRCEICDNTETYFPKLGTVTRKFTVTNFESESGESEFFVTVRLAHGSLRSLEMTVNNAGSTVYIWRNDCHTSEDLYATFSDVFRSTVNGQNLCNLGYSDSDHIYARPYEYFGSVGDSQTGEYTFELKEVYNQYSGFLYSVCVGWYDEEGCSVSGTVGSVDDSEEKTTTEEPDSGDQLESDSRHCEICNSERRYFAPDESLITAFEVNSFQSDSGRHSFFVSVNLEHSNLGSLYLSVWDEFEESNSYGNWILYEDCEGHSNLKATFSNIFGETIEEQGMCSAGLNTEVFARPDVRFGRNIGNETEGRFEVEISVDDDSNEGGYLNEVCIGWYTSSKDDHCQIDGSVTSVTSNESGNDENDEKREKNENGNVATIVISVSCSIVGCLLCVILGYYLYNLKAKKDIGNQPIPAMKHAAVTSLDSVDMAADETGVTSNDLSGEAANTSSGIQLTEVAAEGGVTTAPKVTDAQGSDAPPLNTDDMAGEMVTNNDPSNPDAPPVYGDIGE